MSATVNFATHPTQCDEALQKLYRDICSTSCKDRAAKLQVFSEQMWERLEHHPLPADNIIQGFADILRNDNDILLVRLVVPDFRPGSPIPTNTIKQRLLQINPRPSPLESIRKYFPERDTEVHRLYEEEKTVLQEAELYRAAVLLYGHGNISQERKERLQHWLATYPAEEA
ncbi:hypothetical protein COCC4DRAFT_64061 [Bipolaris maydis ATCC 48331]|uniref:Uncharacterized protein n=2 Tax=Cochliobolus heterostrophus TaxID=5016 RepID=M2THW9_COCH5|nr:uncharacterized protein COCC4DRAFT_64061 [Bipolaris maydis ATCC 48331]EMD86104.1 hypothetical protein COCHEDRAFT_1218948 [Bipolaris maydis C5]KAH7562748.1 hypothetical protein BM1_02268 [Bipolaris maydis]ENI02108.1 hypothetical protein COCC4DRAFT_64061 [Bipolaris maydis ATCC 48331]KAJ5028132.1 hypothetical protein J3E73DRAFT_380646 [Bipolaris maydis]KAJ6265604.1 hypothetical protein PSV08DRAFT_366734 [Bipolaris maydis]